MTTFVYRHEEEARQEFVNGHYELGKPQHAAIDGHDIVYCLGSALLDNSCCGSFGCAYALVIGEAAANAEPLLVREIEDGEALAESIRVALLAREAISTVNFYVPPRTAGTGGAA